MKKALLIVCAAVIGFSTLAFASETRVYLLGDVDDFQYGGAGSIDDVYVNPDCLTYLQNVAPGEPNDDFDVLGQNNNVPFTFLYSLGAGEEVVSATLELGMRLTNSLGTNDWLVLPEDNVWYIDSSNHSTQQVYTYSNLGWSPIAFSGTTVMSVDISDMNGGNQLSLLQDGQFDVYITDDTAIDYAKLTIEVTPEPATLTLLAIGGLAILRRRHSC
jgi:hypothetical protein